MLPLVTKKVNLLHVFNFNKFKLISIILNCLSNTTVFLSAANCVQNSKVYGGPTYMYAGVFRPINL